MLLKLAFWGNYVGIVLFIFGMLARTSIVSKAKDAVFFASVIATDSAANGVARAARIGVHVLKKIYFIDEKISKKSIFFLAIGINLPFYVGLLQSEMFINREAANESGVRYGMLLFVAATSLLGAVLVESLSARMTIRFISKAEITGKFKWLVIDVIALLSVFYIVPAILVISVIIVVDREFGGLISIVLGMLVISTPVFPLLVLVGVLADGLVHPIYSVFATVSVCLPTSLVIISIMFSTTDSSIKTIQFLTNSLTPNLCNKVVATGIGLITISCAYISNNGIAELVAS